MNEGHSTDWEKVYESVGESGGWGYLSKIILRALSNEIDTVKNRKVIEVGSGSGRNSLEFSREGASVILLDLSKDVLSRAEDNFKQKGAIAHYVNASLFEMPFPDSTFDLVWNAGVIEHWVGEGQVNALKQMIRICKEDGLIITLNPYAGSPLNVLGRWIMKRLGKYPFADAVSIRTLELQAKKAGGHLNKQEYSTGFLVLFVGVFFQLSLTLSRFGKILTTVFRILNLLFCYLDSNFGKYLNSVDRLLSEIFGGYLLVSVIKKG